MDVLLWILLVVVVIIAVAFLTNRWLRNRHRGGVIATPMPRRDNDRVDGA